MRRQTAVIRGMESATRRSMLSYANAHRMCQLLEKVFYRVLAQVQACAPPRKKLRFKGSVTTIRLLARTAGLTRVSLFVENALIPESGTGIVENLDLVLE